MTSSGTLTKSKPDYAASPMELAIRTPIAPSQPAPSKSVTEAAELAESPEAAIPPQAKRAQWRMKRGLDLMLSGCGLLAISPLMGLIALLIKLDSPGPVFYGQKRVGYLGRTFTMYKFRTMRPDADKQLELLRRKNETNDLMFKMKQDPRVTRVGVWLRKYSLDELPQLWNVLRGEMSLVGPRPPLPTEVRLYKKGFLRRLATIPGLTCYWQISGRSEIRNFQQVVDLDVQYMRNWSLWRDFNILPRTLPAVIAAKGAS